MSTFSERLQLTGVQENANQFLGTNTSNGQFILGLPTMLTGMVLRSDAGLVVDWTAFIELPNPFDPANPQEWQILDQPGKTVASFDLEWRIPAGAKVIVRTNLVSGADVRAQLIHEPFYRGT